MHPHDCENCRYIGVTRGGERDYDLYACKSPLNKEVTVIARYGADGSYLSCSLTNANPHGHAELWAARTLYERMNTDGWWEEQELLTL